MATAPAGPLPRSLDSLNLPFTRGEPPSFDPALADDTGTKEVAVEIYSGLPTIAPDLTTQPDLAESWTTSDDQKTYTFTLRSDARFADGKPITAQDFKYTFERLADPKTHSPVADIYLSGVVGLKDRIEGRSADLPGIQVLDDRHLQITLDPRGLIFSSFWLALLLLSSTGRMSNGEAQNGTYIRMAVALIAWWITCPVII